MSIELKFSPENISRIADILKSGGVGVIPTDTIYAIAAVASDAVAVDRMYRIRKRDEGKSCIVLLPDRDGASALGAKVTERQEAFLDAVWPGPVSVVLPIDPAASIRVRTTGMTLAFRVPAFPMLRELLLRTGPLLVPSANPQGLRPAADVCEASGYFGDSVDVYADGGASGGEPSTLIRFEGDCIVVMRPGAMILRDLCARAADSGFTLP
jgi:tRNA threonylcarbamoyl adenosine modification protein (Sua5/YciO/YrdC/YwlC family)